MQIVRLSWLLMVSLILALLACNKSQDGKAESAATLVYCSDGAPEGFDPALYSTMTTFDAVAQTVYNRLLDFEPGTTQTVPSLAKKWEVSADKMEYIFHLRPKVKFHTTEFFTPTRELNADDVIFSFQRQLEQTNPWHKYVTGAAWVYAESMEFASLIEKIEKVDDLTVKFKLTKPNVAFLANLALPFASIMSAEYAQQLLDNGQQQQLNKQPLGTGPFVFVSYQQDSAIRYRANPAYWNTKPKVDLVFAITPDSSVRYQKLKNGECHLMPYPNSADIKLMRLDPNIKLIEQEGLNVAYIAFNTTQKPFTDVRVRQALNMAVDKKAIIDAVFQDLAKPAKNPIPPTIWSYNDDIVDYEFNLVKAKELLKEAGVERLDMKLWALPVSRSYMLNGRRAAEIIQADFAKIGVKAEIVTYEWAEYINRSKALDRDGATMLGWIGDNGDPDNFLDNLLSCEAVGSNNRSFWCNKEFNRLVKQAKRSTSQAQRVKLYTQAQVIFKREAPWIPLVHSNVIVPMRAEVKGFVMSPLGSFNFAQVYLTNTLS